VKLIKIHFIHFGCLFALEQSGDIAVCIRVKRGSKRGLSALKWQTIKRKLLDKYETLTAFAAVGYVWENQGDYAESCLIKLENKRQSCRIQERTLWGFEPGY